MHAGDGFLVISGGGTNNVDAYNVNTKAWTHGKALEHKIRNSCSVGCRGLLYTMTGDMVKSNDVGVGAPEDRQIYAYNFTSNTVVENNGEKTRGGAGCACGEEDGVVFFAGGFSDSGITSGKRIHNACFGTCTRVVAR
jgi:hypothetical protein